MLFAYCRVSTKSQNTDSQTKDIFNTYPDADIHSEIISGTVPANERPVLSRVLDKLRKDDVLIVWWIDRLGRDYQDVKQTITSLLNKGVTIKTINNGMTFQYTGEDMTDMVTDIQLNMITAMASAERKNRLASAEAGRQAIKQDSKLWAEKFSGRKPNHELHEKIISALDSGLSVRKVAALVGCSPATVTTVKKQYANQ
ncbi:recombinase family protein [Photobacterium phosphoreum]|uniref:recombinase family protein n=1 Tax=Photobacterium phosphoreum TaxID=659 RepID=UPI0024BBC728|nr:recombinase family protein [Photobacterium phosphoreum]